MKEIKTQVLGQALQERHDGKTCQCDGHGPVEPAPGRRGRQQGVLTYDDLGRATCGGHAQDHLRRTVVEIAPVATKNQGLTCDAANSGPDALDEILEVMRLHEDRGFLAQARGAGLLAFDG